MDRKVVNRILKVGELAYQNEEYRLLLEEYRVLDRRLLRALETMTKEQRDAVMDYLGLFGELHRRQLAIACETGKE